MLLYIYMTIKSWQKYKQDDAVALSFLILWYTREYEHAIKANIFVACNWIFNEHSKHNKVDVVHYLLGIVIDILLPLSLSLSLSLSLPPSLPPPFFSFLYLSLALTTYPCLLSLLDQYQEYILLIYI